MLFYPGLIILILAVSLDSFGVGITYGMRKINVSLRPLLIIMLCNGLVVLISMMFGEWLISFINVESTKYMGGIILTMLGLFSLYNVIGIKKPKTSLNNLPFSSDNKPFSNLLENYMFVVETSHFKNKALKVMSLKESILLGFALAFDSFGAGLGAAMIGYSPFLTASLVALMSGFFICFGIKFGFVIAKIKLLQQLVFIPPFLLMLFGLLIILS